MADTLDNHPGAAFPARAMALTVILGLALVASGCGETDEPNGDQQPSVGISQTQAPRPSHPQKDLPRVAGDRPALAGDRTKARAGAATVGDVYGGLSAAVAAGAASTSGQVGDTLRTAERSSDLSAVCALLSETAKSRTITYVERSSGLKGVSWTCEKATAVLLRRARQAGTLKRSMRATVVGVNAQGDRATATVRFGDRGPLSTVPLVREDGQWKLAASPGSGSR